MLISQLLGFNKRQLDISDVRGTQYLLLFNIWTCNPCLQKCSTVFLSLLIESLFNFLFRIPNLREDLIGLIDFHLVSGVHWTIKLTHRHA
jgi:hypothetical protein